jgi:hypothetical protein
MPKDLFPPAATTAPGGEALPPTATPVPAGEAAKAERAAGSAAVPKQ